MRTMRSKDGARQATRRSPGTGIDYLFATTTATTYTTYAMYYVVQYHYER